MRSDNYVSNPMPECLRPVQSASLKVIALVQYVQGEVSNLYHLTEELVSSWLFKANFWMKGIRKCLAAQHKATIIS